MWWVTRVHPALEVAHDEPVPSEGQLLRSRSSQWLQLAAVAHVPVLAFRDPLWIACVVLVDAVILFELVRNWRRPLVRFSSAELVVASDFEREKRLLTGELSSWAATASVLGLRSADGRLLLVPLTSLSAQNVRTLLAFVRRLPLVGSSAAPLTTAELQRMQRRRLALVYAAVFVGTVLLLELVLPVSG